MMRHDAVASCATIKGREKALQEMIVSLRDQCGVVWYPGDEAGDAVKFNGHRFYKAEYFFTVDDDLIYPPDYVEYMIGKIEEYGRERIVTAHGKFFGLYPISSYYYGGATDRFYCTQAEPRDKILDVGGTGCMAWHRSTIHFPASAFEGKKNMADIWAALHAKRKGVEIVGVAHPADWIKLSPHVDHHNDTIWAWEHEKDEYQTEMVNKLIAE